MKKDWESSPSHSYEKSAKETVAVICATNNLRQKLAQHDADLKEEQARNFAPELISTQTSGYFYIRTYEQAALALFRQKLLSSGLWKQAIPVLDNNGTRTGWKSPVEVIKTMSDRTSCFCLWVTNQEQIDWLKMHRARVQ